MAGFSSSLVSYIILVSVFTSCISVCYCGGSGELDDKFGECKSDTEKSSCQNCQVFTPPVYDGPSYVTIDYHFVNECMDATDHCVDEIHTWLWVKSGAYLLYPLGTFQYISLFFGNPEPLYERKVNVTLNATECYGVPLEYMTLLTQRLKIHIQEQSLYPKMDDSYVPLAANNTTLIELLQNMYYSREPLSSEHILFVCPIIATILVLTIIGIVLTLHICKWKNSVAKPGLTNQTKTNILTIGIVCFNRIFIFCIIDTLAYRYECTLQGQTEQLFLCKFTALLHRVPLTLLLNDLFLLLLSLCFLAAFFILSLSKCNIPCLPKFISKKDLHFYILSLIVICFILGCLMHAPYIAMAYLSDAHYATSVLVYYMTILLIEFGLIQYTFKTYYHRQKHGSNQKSDTLKTNYHRQKHGSNQKSDTLKTNYHHQKHGSNQKSDTLKTNYHRQKHGSNQKSDTFCSLHGLELGLTAITVIVLIVLVYGLVITASFFFYYLPIINLFSNLPNEGIVVYQTALVLIGAYVTYKTLFKAERDQKKLHAILALKRKIKKREIAVLESEIESDKYRGVDCQKILKKKDMIVYLQIEIEIILIQTSIMRIIEGPENPSREIEIDSLDRQEEANIDKLKSPLLSQLRNDHEHLKSDLVNYENNRDERQKAYEQNKSQSTSNEQQKAYEQNKSPTNNDHDPNSGCLSGGQDNQPLLPSGSQNTRAEVTSDGEGINLRQMNGDNQNNEVVAGVMHSVGL